MGNYLDRLRRLEAEQQASPNADTSNSAAVEYEFNEINRGDPGGDATPRQAVSGLTDSTPQEVAESVDASIRMGQRLARGEVAALRCGITGRECRACHGIPCWGSEPWGRRKEKTQKVP